MNVNSADSASLLTGAYEEYLRYERYLALAYGIAFVLFASLLCPGSAWVGSLGILMVLGLAFRKYHLVVHHFVGCPDPERDQAVQLWGTAAQACVWGALPIVMALCALQFYS